MFDIFKYHFYSPTPEKVFYMLNVHVFQLQLAITSQRKELERHVWLGNCLLTSDSLLKWPFCLFH